MHNGRICVLAWNIRSLWNVGSLFRTGDAFGVEKIWLAGYTAAPPRREISKTALGAEEWIAWEKVEDALKLVQSLKQNGWTIVSLEKTDDAMDLQAYQPSGNICLILGNEITGIPDDLLEFSDTVVSIPMIGKKESLNVTVAAGIALAHLRR